MSFDVPEGWRSSKLGECLEDIAGGGTPSRRNGDYWNGTIPWASVKDMTANGNEGTTEHITTVGLQNSSSRLVPAGTVIMATRMAVGVAKRFTCDVAINQDLKALVTTKALLSDEYLIQWMLWNRGNFEAVATGSTVKGIRVNALKKFPILLPPLPEQKKIAAILSSVDEAIEATEAVIEQTRQVKKGLLQELLTRGIGHTEFKKTEIGEIPKSWGVKRLGDLLKAIGAGHSPSCPNEVAGPGDIGVIKVSAIGFGEFFPGENKVLPENYTPDSSNIIRDGDVLFSRANTLELVGACCIVEQLEQKLMLSDKTLRLVPKREIITPEFLMLSLLSEHARIYFEITATGSSGSMKNISQHNLKKLKVSVPPTDEQREINLKVQSLERLIGFNSRNLLALQNLKKGLLQDLLTGKVRVKSAGVSELVEAGV